MEKQKLLAALDEVQKQTLEVLMNADQTMMLNDGTMIAAYTPPTGAEARLKLGAIREKAAEYLLQ